MQLYDEKKKNKNALSRTWLKKFKLTAPKKESGKTSSEN